MEHDFRYPVIDGYQADTVVHFGQQCFIVEEESRRERILERIGDFGAKSRNVPFLIQGENIPENGFAKERFYQACGKWLPPTLEQNRIPHQSCANAAASHPSPHEDVALLILDSHPQKVDWKDLMHSAHQFMPRRKLGQGWTGQTVCTTAVLHMPPCRIS
jgi:hypothetical protein